MQSCGVIGQPPEAVAAAKRTYWNKRKCELKKAKKQQEHSFTVSYTVAEMQRIADAAAMHAMSRTKFIKLAALAYVDKKYLVPNTEALREIKTLLSLNYSLLSEICDVNDLPLHISGELTRKIEELEREVLRILMHPKLSQSDH